MVVFKVIVCVTREWIFLFFLRRLGFTAGRVCVVELFDFIVIL